MRVESSDVLLSIRNALEIEHAALGAFIERLDDSIATAVSMLHACKGRIVVVGVGKSGLVGRKIAATFASTGTPATFVHASEAVHGDLGFIGKGDIALLLSHSGETSEICSVVPHLKALGLPIVAMTGQPGSFLGRSADAVIDTSVEREADPMNLAPTASTTVMLAAGDGIACALMRVGDFGKEEYSKLHPGGSLGQKLMCRVSDLMHTGDDMPVCHQGSLLRDAIVVMTAKRLGSILVVDESNALIGILTDGDLRRALQKSDQPLDLAVHDLMTCSPKSAEPDWLAVDALRLMEDNLITMLPIVGQRREPVGALHMHDLVSAGIK